MRDALGAGRRTHVREAGARVAANVLRDVNVGVPLADYRRIEMLANGLPLWQVAQVAVDGTEPPPWEVLADAGTIEPIAQPPT